MTKKLILDRDAAVLRMKAEPVSTSEISSDKIAKVIEKMKQALHGEEDGVAIAAPQVGESLRIFIVKGGVLKRYPEDMIFINPEIVRKGRKTHLVEEGCLSLRYLYGSVERHERVTLKALDGMGRAVTVGAQGLLAQIFQHEWDHLDGILFTNKATNVKDLPPTKSEERN